MRVKNLRKLRIVAHIIGSNIDVHIIPEDVEYRPELLETLREDLLEIYYQLALKSKDKWNLKRVKENTFSKYKNHFSKEEYDAIMMTIQEAKESSYFEFMCSDTTYDRKEDEDNKVVMGEALIDYYGDLRFFQELWARISERRWERKLNTIRENE